MCARVRVCVCKCVCAGNDMTSSCHGKQPKRASIKKQIFSTFISSLRMRRSTSLDDGTEGKGGKRATAFRRARTRTHLQSQRTTQNGIHERRLRRAAPLLARHSARHEGKKDDHRVKWKARLMELLHLVNRSRRRIKMIQIGTH